MRRRVAYFALFLLAAVATSTATGQELQITVQGGGQLTVRAAAEQQRWVVLDGKILVAAVVDGQLIIERFSWQIDPLPEPGPDPGPDPDPDPDPDPQPTKWQVGVFVESDTLDNLPLEQRALLGSLAVRVELEQRGHYLIGLFDPDAAATATEARIKQLLEAIKGKPLPVLTLAPRAGGKIQVHALPADEQAFWKLLDSARPASVDRKWFQ